MSKLTQDPIVEVPRRVLIVTPFVIIAMLVIGLIFDMPVAFMVIGYLIGVSINLINFRLIVIGTKNSLEQSGNNVSRSMMSNLVTRLFLSAVALILASFISTYAFVTAIIGISMVKFVIQMDGFFSFKN